MENAKDKSSRSSSKVNLNESSLPLLEDQDVESKVEKVAIEMEARVDGEEGEEKSDSGKEKVEGEEGQADGDTKDQKKKDKKEKKKKEKKEKGHQRSSSVAERLTAGLNMLDRDDRSVNDHVNIVFEDVLAEPDANHGFDGVWRLAFVVFSGTKLWVYRILAALLAIPCGILWGLNFSFLTLLNVWVVSPSLRTLDIILHITRRVWSGIIRTFLDPIFQSMGQCFAGINLNMKATRQEITCKEP